MTSDENALCWSAVIRLVFLLVSCLFCSLTAASHVLQRLGNVRDPGRNRMAGANELH
jgi:hypothetical protein